MSDDMHPDTRAALDNARTLHHRIADTIDRINSIRARRPSPNGDVIPEVDGMGRLTGLYLAPGTTAKYSHTELVQEIMMAIIESTSDAARQYRVIMEAGHGDS